MATNKFDGGHNPLPGRHPMFVRWIRIAGALLLVSAGTALWVKQDWSRYSSIKVQIHNVVWKGNETDLPDVSSLFWQLVSPNSAPIDSAHRTYISTPTFKTAQPKHNVPTAPSAIESDVDVEVEVEVVEMTTVLSVEEKRRLGYRMQEVLHDVQHDYVRHMDRHRYGHTQQESSDATKELIVKEPSRNTHSTPCPSHQPGLVVSPESSRRGFCFGAAKLPGKRVCDSEVPDYKKVPAGRKFALHRLYGKTFARVPFFHVSAYTRARRASKGNVTDDVALTSQGTWNRIENVFQLSRRWQGPISFALLLDNTTQLVDLRHLISSHREVSQYVDFHVLWRYDHEATDRDAFYPINLIRNVAMATVEATFAYVIDVDNIPNAQMQTYKRWVLSAEQQVAARNEPTDCPGLDAFVPPAIEMPASRLQEMYAESKNNGQYLSKSSVVKAFFDGSARPMHLYFGPAYLPTNHLAWTHSSKVDRLPYLTRFEPYYIARMPIPLFNETFVNRGGNYAQQVYEMYAGGYRMWRLPFAFIIDIPHTSTETKTPTATSSTVQAHVKTSNLPIETPFASAHNGNHTQNGTNVIENETRQATFDKDFVRRMWLNLYDYLPHRYRFHVPNPAIEDCEYRRYRRSQSKVSNTLWHLMGSDSP